MVSGGVQEPGGGGLVRSMSTPTRASGDKPLVLNSFQIWSALAQEQVVVDPVAATIAFLAF